MRRVLIRNLSRGSAQPVQAIYCASFLCRLRGFTFRRALGDAALLLVQAQDSRLESAIHMLGVWVDLGVVWINSQGIVVDSCLARRWRPFYLPRQPARYVLEMAPERLNLFQIGDQVAIEEM